MVDLPNIKTNLRKELNIPDNATVFAGYGGPTQFSIKMAQNAVYNTAKKKRHLLFIRKF